PARPRAILAPMLPPRRALRFAPAVVALLSTAGCGLDAQMFWVCLNPQNGKPDGTVGDPNHYVGGVFDPCHCYDPCGRSVECPIVVDAGATPLGCRIDGGATSGAGTGGGGQ